MQETVVLKIKNNLKKKFSKVEIKRKNTLFCENYRRRYFLLVLFFSILTFFMLLGGCVRPEKKRRPETEYSAPDEKSEDLWDQAYGN